MSGGNSNGERILRLTLTCGLEQFSDLVLVLSAFQHSYNTCNKNMMRKGKGDERRSKGV